MDLRELNELTQKIIGCAIEVHRHLGPGLLESAYEECLSYELTKNGLVNERQVPVPVIYKEVKLELGYRIDILVEKAVILELKAIECLAPVHEAQILTHLKFANIRIGLLMNFNSLKLTDQLRRFIK
ncbi:MAG TPA: GxxExxY protein [Ignavibacteriaceae bacterium]|nr:GxxExxY protein [Ignavibacteriaceae bacterium]